MIPRSCKHSCRSCITRAWLCGIGWQLYWRELAAQMADEKTGGGVGVES